MTVSGRAWDAGVAIVRSPRVNRTEVDGVPTFWVSDAGPLQAALVFRVGRGDEQLATTGITHLVEHLALSGLHDRRFPLNGMVDHRLTTFIASGESDEICDFLSATAAALGDLPTERLPTERRVLAAEAGTRGADAVGTALNLRFGPNGAGLVGYEEYGLRWVDEDAVQSWAGHWFTAGNAVLWLSGRPPAGLHLPLAAGPRHPCPSPPAAIIDLPTGIALRSKVVAVTMLTGRTPASLALASVAVRRAQEHLRTDLGVSYGVAADRLALSPAVSHLTVTADALADHAQSVTDGLFDVLDELVAAGPAPADLDRMVDDARRAFADGSAAVRRVAQVAHAEILGEPSPTAEAILADLSAVTADEMAAELSAAFDSALVIVPDRVTLPSVRLRPFPQWSLDTVDGHRYSGLGEQAGHELVVGRDGVMLSQGDGRVVTVRFDGCTAALWWANGVRVLHGGDGFRLQVQPNQWVDGPEAVRVLDGYLPRDRWVPMGDGPPLTYESAPAGPAVPAGWMAKLAVQIQPQVVEPIRAVGVFQPRGARHRAKVNPTGAGNYRPLDDLAGDSGSRPTQIALAVTDTHVYAYDVTTNLGRLGQRLGSWSRPGLRSEVTEERATVAVSIVLPDGHRLDLETGRAGPAGSGGMAVVRLLVGR